MNTTKSLIALGVVLCLLLSSLVVLMPANTTRAQPADSPWPMLGQNPQRTGQSPYTGPEVPDLKWSLAAGAIESSPAIGPDGTIYVGSDDKNLYAINPDGSQRWRFTTEWHIRSSPAIGTDGTIYVGSNDRNLYAINPDGSQKWRFSTGGDVYSSPVIGADGTIYVGSWDSNLYALNPYGGLQWSFNTGDVVHSSPAIGADGTIYVGSGDNNLYALNPDGSLQWSFTTGWWVDSSPAIGADGTIYVGSHDRNLYAIHPDGSQKWRFPTGGVVYSSPAIGADGTIYVGSGDNNLYALNPDGSEKWRFTTGDWILCALTIGADGTVYVGSRDNNLYALNPDGTEKWRFATGGWVYSSPAIGADGTIHFGSHDSNLYAIAEAPEYRLSIASAAGGSVTEPGEGEFTYAVGTVVDLVAAADEGYWFVIWTGDADTMANVKAATTTVTMHDDYVITANFRTAGRCFIAAAAYGTPMAWELETLREFRDAYLLTNPAGRVFIDISYRTGPPAAEFITEHPGLKPIVRAMFMPAVVMSTLVVNTTAAQKTAIVGFFALVSVAVALWATKRGG